jgi:hypothetical protein
MREMPGLSPGSAVAGRTGGAARVAAATVLLAVAVVGLRAHGTFSRAAHSAVAGAIGSPLSVLVATGEGIAVVAFAVVLAMARPERKKNPDPDEPPRPPFPWWAKTIAVLAAIAVLVTPFVVLFSKKSRKPVPVLQAPVGRLGVVPTGAGRLTAHGPGGAWPLIAGMVVAIAVVVALTVWSRHRHLKDRARHRPPSLARLLDSLNAGHDALSANPDPRAAIIACYAAMERGFAAAGSAPAAADTPAEVLARAAEAGIIRSGSPEQLTGLFRRARYSAEPMTSADSGAAATALDQMRADLLETQGAAR